MFINKIIAVLLFATISDASISNQGTGWLNKIVNYYKRKFFEEVMKVPVHITASIQPAPPGYVDSDAWDFDSVIHLLVLIKESKTAKPVRRALRRMLQPSRRLSDIQKSFHMFPSWSKNHQNEFYYDIDTDDYYADVPANENWGDIPDDDAVIVVSNPVESRLPSSQISVHLLKNILENRAKVARIMPTTPKPTFSWKSTTTNKSKDAAIASAENKHDVTGTSKSDGNASHEATTQPQDVSKHNTADHNGTTGHEGNKDSGGSYTGAASTVAGGNGTAGDGATDGPGVITTDIAGGTKTDGAGDKETTGGTGVTGGAAGTGETASIGSGSGASDADPAGKETTVALLR